jgi:quinol-cytochrome oxidoreductase complex cytochrome b subunit
MPLLRAMSGFLPAVVLLAALCIDIAAVYRERWRGNAPWKAWAFAACALLGGIVLGVALGHFLPPPAPPPPELMLSQPLLTPPHIVPEWYVLPEYGMLRAIPHKLASVLATLCAVLVPLSWPWLRTDALRTGRTGWLWALLCVLLACAWTGLGYSGSRAATPETIYAARGLAAYYFAFFFLLIPLLHRFSPKA